MDSPSRSEHLASWGRVAEGPPRDQARVVVAMWHRDRSLEPSSRRRLGDLLDRFARRLEATGVRSVTDATLADCEAFVWARNQQSNLPAIATAHLRRTTLRTLYRTVAELTGVDHDPTRQLQLPPKTRRPIRAVTDEEINLLRAAGLARSRGRDRAVTALALAEATATSSEIPRIRLRDVDLTDGAVDLPGAHPLRARRGRLSDWGWTTLRRIATDPRPLHPDGSLTYRGDAGGDTHAGQAQTSGLLRQLLNDAGLVDEDLRPSSIRLWRPAKILDAGGRIETAALMLGLSSLDTAAALLGHDWQTD